MAIFRVPPFWETFISFHVYKPLWAHCARLPWPRRQRQLHQPSPVLQAGFDHGCIDGPQMGHVWVDLLSIS